MYLALKHSHMLLALLSFLFFLIRATWAFQGSTLLENKAVKIIPHIIDTFLLLTAIALMLTISQYPFAYSWLTGKLVGLIAYIIFGTFVIKRAKNNIQRSIFLILSVSSVFYIFLTAKSHNALFFL